MIYQIHKTDAYLNKTDTYLNRFNRESGLDLIIEFHLYIHIMAMETRGDKPYDHPSSWSVPWLDRQARQVAQPLESHTVCSVSYSK